MPLSGNRQLLLWLAAAVWLAVLPPAVGWLLRRIGLTRPNFRGDRIPVGYGLLIVLWSVPVLGVLLLAFPVGRRELGSYVAIVCGMSLLGFIDDLWGDRSVTGLRGHFRCFFIDGQITTGFLKAVGGALLALLVPRVLLLQEWPDAILSGAIIALAANALNLLDLRPGRAGALFLLFALAVVSFQLVSRRSAWPPPLLFVMIPTLVVYERDARARVMMGDAGSNLLGGTLGLAFVLTFPEPTARWTALALLVALHVIAERWSLTRIIEGNPVLRRLDAMTGRR
jgi:UDP-GlcNAc:undecaprenyl-phosphate/decaprenyl-phosphate GlcNAc-1-phosphate transferase